jgi:L-serine dehydratase
VKIGFAARKLLGEPAAKAEILLYGSFLATGRGHGTPMAIAAGLLGMKPDDSRIPNSFEEAKKAGMEIIIGSADLKDAHPNSVLLNLTGKSGKTLQVEGASLGGSMISIVSIDGLSAGFTGDMPTLIVLNRDRPGHVAEVAAMLARHSVNIATLEVHRSLRGGGAVMVIQCDQTVPESSVQWLSQQDGIEKVIYYS